MRRGGGGAGLRKAGAGWGDPEGVASGWSGAGWGEGLPVAGLERRQATRRRKRRRGWPGEPRRGGETGDLAGGQERVEAGMGQEG
jgi:hypothetical protein